jgi:transposase InsO family protein
MHKHLGHPSRDVLQHSKDNTKGFPEGVSIPNKLPVCPGCAKGKMPAATHPPSTSCATATFQRIHSDLKSFLVESYHRYKYFVTFFDDYTSYAWIVCLHTKDAALGALKQFLAMVKTQHNTTVKEWMSDAGGEYKSDAFLKTLKDAGIKILQSAPHTPQQNGRAERFMHTLMDKAEAMRHEACLPQNWWEFAIQHAAHIYNRTSLHHLQWKTPFKLLNGQVPDISHLQVFGCGAYVHIPKDVRVNSLSPKSELMTYLGHTEGIKASLFMRPSNNTLFTSVTTLFDETLFPKCDTMRTRGTTRMNKPTSVQPPMDAEDTTPGDLDSYYPPYLPKEGDRQEQPDGVPRNDTAEWPISPVPPSPPPAAPVPLRRSA